MSDGDIGFDEMGGIGVPEHVWMDTLFDADSMDGTLEDGLKSTLAGVCMSGECVLAVVVAEGREDPAGISVSDVIAA